MKMTNQFGTKFVGTLGKAMTAADWKGRNYIRGYRKPKTARTVSQVKQRGRFEESAEEWREQEGVQKEAYVRSMAALDNHFTAYNAMMQSAVNLKVSGEVWEPPPHGTIKVVDAGTGLPLYMARIAFHPTGRQTPVWVWYTDVNGEYGPVSVIKEDEPYSGQVIAYDYDWYYLEEVTAEEIITTFGLTPS